MSEETRIPVHHTHPKGACGNLVLYLVRNLASGELIKSNHITWPDGRPGVYGEALRCPSCEVNIDLMLNSEGVIYATSDNNMRMTLRLMREHKVNLVPINWKKAEANR